MWNLKVRYNAFKHVLSAETNYDLSCIAHYVFMNSTYRSTLQNNIAVYSKMLEAFHDREDMFPYFKRNLIVIIFK